MSSLIDWKVLLFGNQSSKQLLFSYISSVIDYNYSALYSDYSLSSIFAKHVKFSFISSAIIEIKCKKCVVNVRIVEITHQKWLTLITFCRKMSNTTDRLFDCILLSTVMKIFDAY